MHHQKPWEHKWQEKTGRKQKSKQINKELEEDYRAVHSSCRLLCTSRDATNPNVNIANRKRVSILLYTGHTMNDDNEWWLREARMSSVSRPAPWRPYPRYTLYQLWRLTPVFWPLVFPTRCLVRTLTSPPSSELVLSREQSRDLHDVIARSSLRPRSLIVGHEGRWGTIKGQLHWGRCRLTLSSCARVHARWLFPSGWGPADGKTLQIANILHRQLTGIQELHDIDCNLVVTQSVTQVVTQISDKKT